MPSLLKLLIEHPRFLVFGMLLTCFSGFGQTFFIALFGGELRAEFGLSHGEFGLLYSVATLLSAFTLMSVGKYIDTTRLHHYTLAVCTTMACAALILATGQHIALLLFGIFLIRLSGQGLFGHIASTTVAKRFEFQRGKAISLSALGHPVGEALLPIIGVALIHSLGWRETWLVAGGFVALLLTPLLLWLSRESKEDTSPARTSGDDTPQLLSSGLPHKTQKEVLRDPRFYLILPALLAPALVITGIFFHQVHLVASKGWDLQWFASCFIWFSSASIIASITTGILVDRYGALKAVPYFLIPILLGLMTLGSVNQPFAAVMFMLGAGLTMGAAPVISTATWAEAYGVTHLGGIRSITTALMVFSTAIMPVAMGGLIDVGVSMDLLIILLYVYVLIVGSGAAFVSLAYRREQQRRAPCE